MNLFALVTDIESQVDTSYFNITSLGQLGSRGLQAALIIGGVLAFAYLVWGGIDWLMSEGDKQKLTEARSKITHALIGLAILASVWTIWSLAKYFLGLGQAGGGGSYYSGGSNNSDTNNGAYCAICSTYNACQCINGAGGRCRYAPPECGSRTLTWQPDQSCCE